nr:hypothetical protein HK105_005369 [Polyrhizophydium stewartii]
MEDASAFTTHSGTFTDSGVAGNPPSNAKIVEEFQYLLEKSQQLFAGLRWQPYFQRTFEVYTKIWKFQQKYRSVLDNKEYYGLKRWEIGEIASKIGLLYYNYYMRTSETNYLYESFIFYEAIRDRMYFKDVMEVRSPVLMTKKMRYYSRFIIVCVLLNRNEMAKVLVEELAELINEYIATFTPNDANDWHVVLSEMTTFLEAEKRLAPLDFDGSILHFPSRIQLQNTLKFDKDGAPKLKLQEAILVGNHSNQIKISELTLDIYRVLQSLEREPTTLPTQLQPAIPQSDPMTSMESREGAEDVDKSTATRRTNPHRYLLYRPTFAQLMLYIATAFKDISENSAMLLYLSADGAKRAAPAQTYAGGVSMAINYSRKPGFEKPDPDQTALVHTLHPDDLMPFTRKPLFVIVDSNNSSAFTSFSKVFEQPFVCLLSPTEYPASIKDTTHVGGLFTLFLHAPIKGLVFVCDLETLSPDIWSQCVFHADATEKLIAELIEKDAIIDKSFKRFAQDDFLRNFMVRFILCHAILSHHTAFKESKHLPSSFPTVPQSVLAAPELSARIQELVRIANTSHLYSFDDHNRTVGVVASGAALVAALVFVLAFGPTQAFRHTIVGDIHSLVTKRLPSALASLAVCVFGERGVAFLKRQANWVGNEKHPLGQLFYLLLTVGGLIEFCISTLPHLDFDENWWALAWMLLVIVPVVAITFVSFYKACYTDPGFVTKDNVDKVLDKFDYDYWLPARSKHCSTCKGCIAELDHHCVWSFYCTYGCLYALDVLSNRFFVVHRLDQAYYRDPVTHAITKLPISMQIRHIMRVEPRLSAFVAFTAMCALIVFAFLAYHMYTVLKGMTTNESFKWEDIRCADQQGLLEDIPKILYEFNRDYPKLRLAAVIAGPDSDSAKTLRKRCTAINNFFKDVPDEDDDDGAQLEGKAEDSTRRRRKESQKKNAKALPAPAPEKVAYLPASKYARKMRNIYDLGLLRNLLHVMVPPRLE